MSLDELVDYFVQFAREAPRKRPSAEVAEKLTNLEKISREDGLRPNDILLLVDVAASGVLAATASSRLIRSLIPAETVPERAVVKAVSWMCTNKPSSTIQTLLVRWILLIYELMDGHDQLHALYGVIFYFLENDQMCPYVCHLLYLLTRQEDVLLFRLRALINLQQRLGSQTYIIGLLSVFKLYCPQLVTITLPRVPKSFFKQTDRAWEAVIRRVQEKHTEIAGEESSLLQRTALSPNQRLDTTSLEPFAKRRRSELVPGSEVCTVRADHKLGFSRQGKQKRKAQIPISLVKSFDELKENLENIEMPARVATVLQNTNLQHYMSLHSDPVTAHRLSYWVHHALTQEFSYEPTPFVRERQSKLLNLLVNFCDFMQESMPVVENFLINYLHTWNGMDHRDPIFKLISRMRLMQPAALNDLVLEPLRKLYFASSVFFKCQVLWCLTQLLINYASVEWPRYENNSETQKIATRSNQSEPDFYSMFPEEVEDFSCAQTLHTLLHFVDTVCIVGLPAEKDHELLTHCLADFYTEVTQLSHTWDIPLVSLPHRGLFYRMLFTNSVVTLARLADLMIRYRESFADLRKNANTEKTASRKTLCTQSLSNVGHFNKLLLDMCNVLWRDQAFLPVKPGSVFELLDDARVKQLGILLEKDAFSLRRHPALMGHVLRFIQETQPAGKKCHISEIRSVLDYLLLYLESQHISYIPTFINISIKRTKSTTKTPQPASTSITQPATTDSPRTEK